MNHWTQRDAHTGGPCIRTCPGKGRLWTPNHIPDAEDNNTIIPALRLVLGLRVKLPLPSSRTYGKCDQFQQRLVGIINVSILKKVHKRFKDPEKALQQLDIKLRT